MAKNSSFPRLCRKLADRYGATFNLAYNAWVKAIERTLQSAREKPVANVVTAKVSERFEWGTPSKGAVWYK